jgi:hypothetical protein
VARGLAERAAELARGSRFACGGENRFAQLRVALSRDAEVFEALLEARRRLRDGAEREVRRLAREEVDGSAHRREPERQSLHIQAPERFRSGIFRAGVERERGRRVRAVDADEGTQGGLRVGGAAAQALAFVGPAPGLFQEVGQGRI